MATSFGTIQQAGPEALEYLDCNKKGTGLPHSCKIEHAHTEDTARESLGLSGAPAYRQIFATDGGSIDWFLFLRSVRLLPQDLKVGGLNILSNSLPLVMILNPFSRGASGSFSNFRIGNEEI